MNRRTAIVVILLGLVVGALVIDGRAEDEAALDSAGPVPDSSVFPIAAEPGSLSSTWFCAGGTADEEQFADHRVHIANTASTAVTVTVTAFGGTVAPPQNTVDDEDLDEPDDTADDDAADDEGADADADEPAEAPPVPEPVKREIEVPARSSHELALSELVQTPVASALVETSAGGVVVEHAVTSVHGHDVKPCVTSAASTWHFAWGDTTVDARELLVLFNPFPDDAIVDGRFSTEDGVRQPERFEGLVVPARGSIAVDLGDDVTRREEVAGTITARNGRIVVDRILRLDGDDARGLTVQSGTPEPQTTWVYPDGYVSDEVREEYVVYNPGDELAEVEIEFVVDDPETNGVPEAVTLSLVPGSHQVVDIGADGRIPAEVAHTGIVRSANGVPIVAERVLYSQRDTRQGVSVTTGAPVEAEQWTFAAGAATDEVNEFLVLANLDQRILATFDVTAIIDGRAVPVSELQDVELGAGERRAIWINEHIPNREELTLVVTSSEPIVAERALYRSGEELRGASNAVGVPSPGGVRLPPDPLTAGDEDVDLGDVPQEDGDGDGDGGETPEAPDDVDLPEPDETIVIEDPDAEAEERDETDETTTTTAGRDPG